MQKFLLKACVFCQQGHSSKFLERHVAVERKMDFTVTAQTDGRFGSGIFCRPKKFRKIFNGPSYTPLSGIRLLAERGYLVVTEEFEMTDQFHPEFYQRRWRARVYDGRDTRKNKFVGLGEAPRKSLAKESAAMDFLIQVTLEESTLSLPAFQIPKNSRICSSVVSALEYLCKKMKYGTPVYDIHSVFVKGRDKYQVTVDVNGKKFKEIAYELKYAKYGAAKLAFDSLSGSVFELDKVIMGSDCLLASEREDAFVGSEELHIVSSKSTVQLGRVFKCEPWNSSRTSSPVSWYDGKSGRESNSGSSIMSPAPKRMRVCFNDDVPKKSVLEKIRKHMLDK
ncbi:unnamed protein product [Allacma fusca]|uniref:Uncharacterized protein n=1 Tax=Allacma fusca TaxID=39272 RepID=A0A8J2JX63_9HEXA|nr:unnamed protein product [Allacma fusca]